MQSIEPAAPAPLFDAAAEPVGLDWQLVTDAVMGGLSTGSVTAATIAGRPCLRLRGDVDLANNGGFVQIAADLDPHGNLIDARAFDGLELDVRGNGHGYNVHLRTADTQRPWQSYRAHFHASPAWQRLRLPFAAFEPHRLDSPLDLARLRRIGIVAIGEAFEADVGIARLAFYSDDRT